MASHNRPAVVGPMPTHLAEMKDADGSPRFTYTGKSFSTFRVDSGTSLNDYFEVTGVFLDNSSLKRSNLVKATSVVFDCDLVDVVLDGTGADGNRFLPLFVARAKEFFAQHSITQVYTTSKGEVINVNDASDSLDPEEFKAKLPATTAVIKAYLTYQPAPHLTQLVTELLPTHIAFISEQLNGKLPTIATYSGTGYHLHYFLDDNDGWGESGLSFAAEGQDAKANIDEMKVAYKKLNAAFGKKFGYTLDNKLSQIGTAATRNIGTINGKNARSPKTVAKLDLKDANGNPLTDENTRLTCADFVIPAAKEEEAKSKPRDAAKKNKGGRPKKAKEFKPYVISGDETITIKDASGAEKTFTVEEVAEAWDQFKQMGLVTTETTGEWKGMEKLTPCRLDWISNSSLNAWVRKDPNDDRGALRFICDVQKYSHITPEAWHDKDGSGHLVGHWVYRGSLFSQLVLDEKGRVVVSGTNLFVILDRDPRFMGQIRTNTRLNRVEVSAKLHIEINNPNSFVARHIASDMWVPINDMHETYIGNALQESYFNRVVSTTWLHAQINLYANMRGVDPVHTWIESVAWDGKNRLDTWLPELLNMPKTHENYKIYAAYGRTAMLSIVRATYTMPSDPVMFQTMLVFAGKQEDGKSTLAALLGAAQYVGREYFSESELAFDKPADLMAQLRGKMVAEIPEMASMTKHDMNTIKSFLTKGSESQREAYAKNRTLFDRATYFVGTTNQEICLKDPTGNRRFMVVNFYKDYHRGPNGERWDKPAMEAAIPQLYAEAYQRVVLGQHIPQTRKTHLSYYQGAVVEDWNLTQEERALQDELNLKFSPADVVNEAISEILERYIKNGQLTLQSTSVMSELKQADPTLKIGSLTLSNLLSQNGWSRRKTNGRMVWEYQGAVAKPKTTKASKPKKEPRREPQKKKAVVTAAQTAEEAIEMVQSGAVTLPDDDKARFDGLLQRFNEGNAIVKISLAETIKTLVNVNR